MRKHHFEFPREPYQYAPSKGSPSKPKKESPLSQKKIQNLHDEFQTLKNKIKEVEEKNQVMLKKIKGKTQLPPQRDEDSLEEVVSSLKLNLFSDFNQPDFTQ